MALRLYFMRHGETAWSLSGQHTGRSDISLTKQGEAEALRLGRRIRAITFAQAFCSPLLRARQTAELAGFSKTILIEADLAEWDNGDYEGKTYADVVAGRPNWNLFHDGCPNGEMPADIAARADRLVDRFSALDGNIAVFAHSHLGRVLAARWLGLAVEHAECFILDTASLSILSYDREDGKPRSLRLWNSTPKNSFPRPSLEDSQAAGRTKQRAIERWENEGGEVVAPSTLGQVDKNFKRLH
jgi:broad specificity phosphatase PhoE